MQKHSKIVTGFTFLDQKWGGAYPGGSYLLFGARKSGKSILGLNIIEHLIQANYNVLLISTQRKKGLEIQSSSIYFDLDEAVKSGMLTIKKVTEGQNGFDSITGNILETKPDFIFIDDFSDTNFNPIHLRLIEFIEFIENKNITSFFISSIQNNDYSKNLIRKIARITTAIIQLQKGSSRRDYSGRVILKPNIGYFEGEFETSYKVEPIKGFITLSDNEKKILEMFSRVNGGDKTKKEKPFSYSNLYSVNEFEFLIDSKIALSDKTGKRINLISYSIVNKSFEPRELCNLFLEKLDKSDKICCTKNKLFILPNESRDISPKKIMLELDESIKTMIDNPDQIDKYVTKNVQILNNNFQIGN